MKERKKTVSDMRTSNLDFKQLNQNLAQYKQIFNVLDEGLLIISKDGIILETNKKTEEIFGLNSSHLAGQHIKKLFKKNKTHKTQAKDFLKNLVSNQSATFSFLFTKPDAQQIYGKLTGEKLDETSTLFVLKISKVSEKAEHLLFSDEPGSLSRLLFESAHDAILIMDDEKFILCNPSALRIFGCKDYDELVYHSPWEFSPQLQADGKDSMLKAKLYINNALEGTPQEFDWLHMRKDGSLMEAEVSLNALEFKGSKYIQAIVRDVSSRNEAERKIKENETRFRSLFNNINAGIALHEIILDETGKPIDFIFLDVNPVYEEITKLKAADVIGKCGRDVIPNLEQKWIDTYGRVAKTGLSALITDHSQYLDKWWEVKAFSPKKGQFAVVLNDITERRLNQQKLEKNRESMQQAEEIAQLGYFERNWQTSEGYWSKGFYRLLGFHNQQDAFTHEEIMDYLHPDDKQRINEEVEKSMKEGTVINTEFRISKKDGKIIRVQGIAKTIFDNHGKPVRTIGILRDITETHETKKQLKAQNLRLSNLISNIKGMVYRCKNDRDWTMEFVSDGCFDLTGFKAKHLIGNKVISFNDLILPKYQEKLWKIWQQRLKAKKPVEVEYEIQTASGEIKWVWERGRGIYDEQGNLLHIEGIISDITERKLAEERAEKLSKAVEQSPESIVITDKQGTIEYINPQFTKLTGYTFEEATGQNPNILQSGEHDKAFYKQLWDTILSGNTWHSEIRNKKKNGELYWERASISPIFNNQNEITHFVAVKEDITHDKKIMADLQAAKEAAEESEEKFRQLAESAKVAISIIGDPMGKEYLYCNRHWTEVTGYQPENVKDIKPADIIHPDMVEKVLKNAENRIQGKPAPTRYELKIITKSGETRYLDFSSVPIIYGKQHAFLTTGIDITEKKKNRDRLKKANAELIIARDRAEESDRLKSAFLANMSHEIRTPMNGIMGFAELLAEPGLTGEKQTKYVHVILKSGERMLNIINDLIDISKIEAGQVEVSLSTFNIRHEADDIFTFFSPEMKKKNLAYSSRFPDEENLVLSSDKEKVYAVLINLLKNAIKYTRQGSVEFGYEVLRKENTIAGVKYYVKDTGIGVPAERLTAIFERFVQADIEDKKAQEGAGLGLAISKAYAKMLGGDLWVESEYGKGSTFYFTVPNNPETPINDETNAVKSKPLTAGKKLKKILIAEDDEYSDIHLTMLLKNLAGEILHASDGLETVEICRNNPDIDLVLMDIKMPGMNGYQATQKIRSFNKKVIIIAQTAYALAGDRQKALDAGCDDYVAKPIKQNVLLDVINKHFK